MKDKILEKFAYDTGATDSGINHLKEDIKKYLLNLSEDEFRLFLSRLIREEFLSKNSLEQGYGIEDVSNFINWIKYDLEIDI